MYISTARKITFALLLSAAFVPAIFLSPLIKRSEAATCTWSGGSGNWETAGNWSNCGGGVPGSGDDVIIDANVTVTLNASTTINSLTLGNSGGTTTPTLNFNYDAIANGALVIDEGDVILYQNATITHPFSPSLTVIGTVFLDVQTGSFTIYPGSAINADAKGYAGAGRGTSEADGVGPGGGDGYYDGSCGGDSRVGGAGHGGRGGDTYGLSSGGFNYGGSYGNHYNPITLGSGGGRGRGYGICGKGGNGGGAIKLSVGNTLIINGSITADAGTTEWRGGGGSGGSIWINAGTIAGSGGLSADGSDTNSQYSYPSAGGGGGHIALFYRTAFTFSGTSTVAKGWGTNDNAEIGTIFREDTTNNDIYFAYTTNALKGEDRSNWNFRNINFSANTIISSSNGELLQITSSGTTTFSDNITVVFGGSYTTNTDGQGVSLDLSGDVTVPSNTIISAIGRGYIGGTSSHPYGYGYGGGVGNYAGCGGDYKAGGGGHAGSGATGQGAGGTTYGNSTNPTTLGSGGGLGRGNGYCGYGGAGGGAIKLVTDGTLNVIGTISANGNVGGTTTGAGGAGGSLYIKANILSGSGTISAAGGNGGNGSGGGGGGYIALYYSNTTTFSGTINVAKGSGGTGGGNGIITYELSLPLGQVRTELSISNTAPTFSVAPYEDPASTATTPTNISSNVTFKATATDANEDDYYLAVCSSNSITPGSGGAPTCGVVTWCVSSATTQGTEASCGYQTLLTDSEVNAWYAFVCDGSACSSSSQGSGDSGSPFEVNHAPTISSTSAGSGNPQGYGSSYTITVTTTAADSDTSGSSDTTKLVVCSDNSGATSAGCDGGDDLCSSSLTASNPSCNFDLPTTIEDGSYNYYAYVFDSHDFGTNSDTSTYTVNNVAPIVTTVTVNGGSDITLNDQNTSGGVTSVVLSATITDYNSCQDLDTVSGYLYRTGVGYASCTAQDNNDCYYNVSCSVNAGSNDCTSDTDAIADYTCTVSMQYHGDPTDGSAASDSPWYAETWKDTIKAVDNSAAEDDTEVVTGVEVNSTTAFTVTTALAGPKISYGNMTTGSDSGLIDDTDTNQITTLTATGNVGLDQEISGTTLIYSSYTIPITNQKHGFSTFTYSSGGTALSGTATQYEQNCLKTTVTATPATAKTYWGILIPSNSGAGTYSGTNYLNGIKGEAGDW